MKFLKVLFILSALLVVLVGCGDNNNNENINNENNNNETQNTIVSNENNITKSEFSMGAWNGNVYTNDFLDIKFDMPASWSHYTDAEIAEVMDMGKEVAFGDDEFLKSVSEKTSVYYVVASDSNTGNSLSIVSEKPIVDVQIEQYMTQLKTQLDSLEAIKYETGEVSIEKVGNVEYNILEVTVPDYNMSQKYYVKKSDKYFVGIIITAYDKEDIAEIIDMFE